MRKFYLCLSFLVFIAVGCVNQNDGDYPSAFMFKESIYLIEFGTPLAAIEKLGDEIGKIERQTEPFPKKNLDSNIAPPGSTIYRLQDTDDRTLVIQINDKYYHSTKKMEQ